MTSKIVFHLAPRFVDTYRRELHLQLYARISDLITSRGGEIILRHRAEALRQPHASDWSAFLEAEHLHIIENGMVRQAGALNSTLAYLPPHYHLDPNGVLANSSAGAHRFHAADVAPQDADRFWTQLHNRFVKTRVSRYSQPQDITPMPEGAIAVFLQGDTPAASGTAYCNPETLLRSVAAHADGRPVIVKAHPMRNVVQDSQMILRLLSEGVNVVPTDANIHDILRACAVTVSFNSAVALEGFLYGKPAILFGRADFHHVCETVRDPAQFATALETALRSAHDYKRFLYWYFKTFCVSLEDPQLDAKILQTFADQGFDAARLGLSPPQTGRDDAKTAAQTLQTFLMSQPSVTSARVREALKVTASSWVFVAQVNGEKVVVKRFFGQDIAHTVRSLKGELDHLEGVFGDGPLQVNRCLMAWPKDGIAVLSYAPGQRLGDKIAASKGETRQRIVAQSGAWLARYTADRTRQTTFAPKYWIKRLRGMSLDHIDAADDVALLERMLAHMATQVPHLRGCPVVQAATHGDYVGMNAHYHRGTIYGVDIQGEHWLAVAREVARFLVWQQIHEPPTRAARTFGMTADDVTAFLSSGVLNDAEHHTTLPFFIGEQLYFRFVENYARPALRDSGRKAMQAYLHSTPAPQSEN